MFPVRWTRRDQWYPAPAEPQWEFNLVPAIALLGWILATYLFFRT